MEHISSDTNVWIDFFVIGRTEIPFHLPYIFIMNCDALDDELLSPSGLREKLLQCGLISVELTIEQFGLAEELGSRYPQLSIYDRIALAIAIVRKIVLLTGDRALRQAAKRENVKVLGTIGILDQLLHGSYIDEHNYEFCLQELQKHNGQEVRLPRSAINSRLQRLKK